MTDRIALVAVLADTLVPALEDAGDDAVAAFRRRAASDLGVADLLAPALTATQAALIDELGARGFASSRPRRPDGSSTSSRASPRAGRRYAS